MPYKLANGSTVLTQLERIELGQAKNQATEILSQIWTKIIPAEREELYKKAVKQLYRWNRELDAEVIEAGQEQQKPEQVKKIYTGTNIELQSKSQPSLNLPTGSRYPEHEKGKYGERR